MPKAVNAPYVNYLIALTACRRLTDRSCCLFGNLSVINLLVNVPTRTFTFVSTGEFFCFLTYRLILAKKLTLVNKKLINIVMLCTTKQVIIIFINFYVRILYVVYLAMKLLYISSTCLLLVLYLFVLCLYYIPLLRLINSCCFGRKVKSN